MKLVQTSLVLVALAAAVSGTFFESITITDVQGSVNAEDDDLVDITVVASFSLENVAGNTLNTGDAVTVVIGGSAYSVLPEAFGMGSTFSVEFPVFKSTAVVEGDEPYATVRVIGANEAGSPVSSEMYRATDVAPVLGANIAVPAATRLELTEDSVRLGSEDGAVTVTAEITTVDYNPVHSVVVSAYSDDGAYMDLYSETYINADPSYWNTALPSDAGFTRAPEAGKPSPDSPTVWSLPLTGTPNFVTTAGTYKLTTMLVMTPHGSHTVDVSDQNLVVEVRANQVGLYAASVGGLLFAGAVGGAYSQRRAKTKKGLMKKKAASGAAVAKAVKADANEESESAEPAYDSLQAATGLLAKKTPEAKAAAEEAAEKKSTGEKRSRGGSRRSGGSKRRSGGSKRSRGSTRSKGSVRFEGEKKEGEDAAPAASE